MTTQPYEPSHPPVPRPPTQVTPRPLLRSTSSMSQSEQNCLAKVSHPTFEVASAAAFDRMATDCDHPLYIYRCPHCSAFHLTSTRRRNTEPPRLLAAPRWGRVVIDSDKAASRREWQGVQKKTRRVRRSKARRFEEAESRIEAVLPRPRVATDSEVAAFFDRHGPTTATTRVRR